MQAIGIFETKGLLAAIEALDVMLKAADVQLMEHYLVGGGLVCIVVTGEVSAVNASVTSAEAAVLHLGGGLMKSVHVIPRPDGELETILSPPPSVASTSTRTASVHNEAEPEVPLGDDAEGARAEIFQPEMSELEALKTVELRNLARQYDDFPIQGREISKAKKRELLDFFRTYYDTE